MNLVNLDGIFMVNLKFSQCQLNVGVNLVIFPVISNFMGTFHCCLIVVYALND